MSLKCESCRYFSAEWKLGHFRSIIAGNQRCEAPSVLKAFNRPTYHQTQRLAIMLARDICDREGDGRFVYFEPRDTEPSAGAAFVQITRDRKPQAMKAAA